MASFKKTYLHHAHVNSRWILVKVDTLKIGANRHAVSCQNSKNKLSVKNGSIALIAQLHITVLSFDILPYLPNSLTTTLPHIQYTLAFVPLVSRQNFLNFIQINSCCHCLTKSSSTDVL